ncbi:DUF2612 domain-containing protein [candidate division KSB1 bacterium]|nr:DUF2612 domain-containing protein [candidate division KSB1 bacterium]
MGARAIKAIARLLNEFSDGENWEKLFTAIAARFEDTDIVLSGLLLMRTIETAEGVWLDQVGEIVGFSRPAEEVSDSGIFTLKGIGDPDDGNKGFSSLGALDGGVWTSLNGLPTENLASDTVYREYLFGKVKATYSKVTIPAIYEFIKFVFDVESEVRSPYVNYITVELATALTGAQRRIIERLAPIKAGALLEIINWP